MKKKIYKTLIFMGILLTFFSISAFAQETQETETTHVVSVKWLLDPNSDCQTEPPFEGTTVIGSYSFEAVEGEEVDVSEFTYNPAGASYWQEGFINYNGQPCYIEFTYGQGGNGINPNTGEAVDGLPFSFDPFGTLTMPGTDVELYYIYGPYRDFQPPQQEDGLDKIVIYVNRPNGDKNPVKQEYRAYEIFHVGKADNVEEDVTNDYSVGQVMPEDVGFNYWILSSDPWFNVIQDCPYFDVIETPMDGYYNVKLNDDYPPTEETAIEIASYLEDHIPEGVEPKIVTADTPSYDNDPGYYLIISDINSNLILGTTNIAITEKAEYPTIQKEVDDDQVEIGQTVTFTIDVYFPQGSKAESIITDTMSEGLTYVNDSIELSIGDDYEYNFETTDDGWVITIPSDVVKELFKDSEDTITITYQAVINENAVVNDPDNPNRNNVKLDFSNYTAKAYVDVFLTYLEILKYDANDEEKKPLPGAIFSLVDEDDNVIYLSPVVEGELYTIASEENENKIEKFVTANSKITINGLASDKQYYLKEITAPAGYNLLESEVLIDDTYIEIANNSGSLLPSTGGTGTEIFYITGGGLILICLIAFFIKKKRES